MAWAADAKHLLTVAICTQEETAAMETALSLPAELRQRAIPIFVRLAEESGSAGVLECAQLKLGFRAFGSIHDGCRIPDDLDLQARALHEAYLAEARRPRVTGRSSVRSPPRDREA